MSNRARLFSTGKSESRSHRSIRFVRRTWHSCSASSPRILLVAERLLDRAAGQVLEALTKRGQVKLPQALHEPLLHLRLRSHPTPPCDRTTTSKLDKSVASTSTSVTGLAVSRQSDPFPHRSCAVIVCSSSSRARRASSTNDSFSRAASSKICKILARGSTRCRLAQHRHKPSEIGSWEKGLRDSGNSRKRPGLRTNQSITCR